MLPQKQRALKGKPQKNTINHHLDVLGCDIAYAESTAKKVHKNKPHRLKYMTVYRKYDPWMILREAQLAYRQRMKEYYAGEWSDKDAKRFGEAYGWIKKRLS